METRKYANVDEYIADFEGIARDRLELMRETVREAAPDAEEMISYGMPAYKMNGPLVYFAAYANHIGFYATPTGHQEFAFELSRYKQGKGSVQFPHDERLPIDLVRRIVEFRVEEKLRKSNDRGRDEK